MAAAPNPQRQPAYTETLPARYPLTALALMSEPSYMLPRRVRWFGGPRLHEVHDADQGRRPVTEADERAGQRHRG